MSSRQLRAMFAQYLPGLLGALMGLIAAATSFLGGQASGTVPVPYAPGSTGTLTANPAAPGTTGSGAVPTPPGATLTGSTSTGTASTTGSASSPTGSSTANGAIAATAEAATAPQS